VNPEELEMRKAAKARAEAVQAALVRGDFDAVADDTHPRVVEELGGRGKMLATLAATLDEMRAEGAEFRRVDVHDVTTLARAGKDVYVYVPIDVEMKVPGRLVRTRGGLIGVSPDGGKTWTFVDTSPGRAEIKRMIPELPDAIDIPAKGRPKVMED